MKMILSSLALSPHHLSLRTRVRVLAVWSIEPSLNGPSLVGIASLKSLTNFFGSLLVAAGYSGENKPCHSL